MTPTVTAAARHLAAQQDKTMTTPDQQLETAIVAPRITPDDIEGNITYEEYFTAAQGVAAENAAYGSLGDPGPKCLELLTFCVLVLRNGTKVVGVNYGAIDPARHSAEMGRVEARKEAVSKIWELMGYELRSKLAAGA
ncbi:Gp49 family protein [Hydrogenophaga defluvii]|uniref:Gp49 family protein n=1 Tax=Hydrogenophaga defluvii TaxID=249410 RepID=A0ABW2SBS6_9BURK